MAYERVILAGREFDAMTEEEVAEYVVTALGRGEGGRIVTPNVDILRLADRSSEVRGFIEDATLVVADGMPLVWASKLAGQPLPERVAGSGLIWTISQAVGEIGGSIYLLGGVPAESGGAATPRALVSAPFAALVQASVPAEDDWLLMADVVGVSGGDWTAEETPTGPEPSETTGRDEWLASAAADPDDPGYAPGCDPRDDGAQPPLDGAARAAAELAAVCAGLVIAGCDAPPFGFDDDPDTYAMALGGVIDAQPDVCFVGLGFPRQERIISDLRNELPRTWFLGCGAAINFVAGAQQRAPLWMQRSGLEWAHRLAQEPRRLASRYLRHDAPYAVKLLTSAALRRN